MGRRVYVGKVSELENHEIEQFVVEGQEIAIARIDDRVHAVSDTCTHRQCSLSEGLLEEGVVTCPCHGAEFDLATGEAVCLPAKEPLRLFDTAIDGDDLYLQF